MRAEVTVAVVISVLATFGFHQTRKVNDLHDDVVEMWGMIERMILVLSSAIGGIGG